MSNGITIQPLGGVGEIGSNCTLFETASTKLFVDYGILFPYENFFNISYLAAEIDHLGPTDKNIILFISHGHEDHIGAIFLFIEKFPQAKIYAPKFAELLIRKKLSERGIPARIDVYDESLEIKVDNYTYTPVRVTHSIPDTYGLIVKENNNENSVLFISDFKFDLNPLYEPPFNYKKVKRIFEKSKFNVCLMDSTNILNPGRTVSESELVEDFVELLARENRIFVTLFSSNIHRIRTIKEAATKNNKKIVLIGRSIKHYVQCAQDMGLLDHNDIIADEKSLIKFDNKHVYVLTGCQGDYFGALRRAADNEVKNLNIEQGDLFVFSSKAIPGNEKQIYRIYNKLTEKGAEIITARDMNVHASGHPSQEDLIELYDKIKPDIVIPIHGESYFLKKHVEFCKSNNINSRMFFNNSSLIINGSNIKQVDDEKIEPKIYHSNDMELDRSAISQRRKLALNGLCLISINKTNRALSLKINGLPNFIYERVPQLEKLIKGQLSKKLMQKHTEDIEEEIRIFSRNLFSNYLGYKPMTFVQVI